MDRNIIRTVTDIDALNSIEIETLKAFVEETLIPQGWQEGVPWMGDRGTLYMKFADPNAVEFAGTKFNRKMIDHIGIPAKQLGDYPARVSEVIEVLSYTLDRSAHLIYEDLQALQQSLKGDFQEWQSYVHKPTVSYARQVTTPEYIATTDGLVLVPKGAYITIKNDGSKEIHDESSFNDLYGLNREITWLEHHRESELLASSAEDAWGRQEFSRSTTLYELAGQSEEKAVRELLSLGYDYPPRVIGTLAVSAVALYLKGHRLLKVEELSVEFMSVEGLPAAAAAHIQNMLESIRSDTAEVESTSPIPEE